MAEKKKDVTESTEIVVVEVTEELLREKLYEVRGVKVMLDSDLAEIYGYTTRIRRNVKNHKPHRMLFNSSSCAIWQRSCFE